MDGQTFEEKLRELVRDSIKQGLAEYTSDETMNALMNPFVTAEEFAKRIHVNPKWVSTMKSRGLIPSDCILPTGERLYVINWVRYCQLTERDIDQAQKTKLKLAESTKAKPKKAIVGGASK